MTSSRVSLSLPRMEEVPRTDLNFMDYQNMKNDDGGDTERDDIDPPVQLFCGHDRLRCCSSKLHGSIFTLSIIFILFYLMGSVGAWVLFFTFAAGQDPKKFATYMALSVSFRLIGSIFLLVGALTRFNGWILLNILVSLMSFGLFLTGTILQKPIVSLTAIGLACSDLILGFLLHRFMGENRHFPLILAEKKQRYNQAIRKLLQEAKNDPELEEGEEGDQQIEGEEETRPKTSEENNGKLENETE